MFHPLGGDEFIGDFADHPRLAAHQQYFQAIVMVQMHVYGRENHVVMVVLDVRERGLEMRLVMVLDQGNGARDVFAAEFLPVFDQMIANHVSDGQRPVVVAS